MTEEIGRRQFLGVTAATAFGATLAGHAAAQAAAEKPKPLRVGMAWWNWRARFGPAWHHARHSGRRRDGGVRHGPSAAQDRRRHGLRRPGSPSRPRVYGKDEQAYRTLMERDDLDAGAYRDAVALAHAHGRVRDALREVRGRGSTVFSYVRRMLGTRQDLRGDEGSLHDAGKLEFPPGQSGGAAHDSRRSVWRDCSLPTARIPTTASITGSSTRRARIAGRPSTS